MKQAKWLLAGTLVLTLGACSQGTIPSASEQPEQAQPSNSTLSSEERNNVDAIYSLSDSDLAAMKARIDEIVASGKKLTDDSNYQQFVSSLIEKNKNNIRAQDDAYGNISFDEKVACVSVSLFNCANARALSYSAVDATKYYFSWQTYGDGNEGNAFQHSYWNTMMTVSMDALSRGQKWRGRGGTRAQSPFSSDSVRSEGHRGHA